MKSSLGLLGLAFLMSTSADAIVVRHDVPKEKYLVELGPAALVDMRHEGHGMLIAPQWVVTAAHTVFYDYKDKGITVGGVERMIDYVIFHEGYTKPPKGIFQGNAAPSQAYLRGNDDIVLIKLKEPVTGIEPIRIYEGDDEVGKVVTLYGRGNTGDGKTGQIEKTKGTLRTAQNTISEAREQWLHYRFDQGSDALPLEGFQGNGDSGGPAMIQVEGEDFLLGLASWDVYEGELANFHGSLYGMDASLVRLSHYADWIKKTMALPDETLAARHNKIAD